MGKLKHGYCEGCSFEDELMTEQPCCGCVDGINFVSSETAEADKQIKEMVTILACEGDLDIFIGGYDEGKARALYNAGYRRQGWISVDDRLPTVEEEDRGLVGIVHGYNGKIQFTHAFVFVMYDFDDKVWWSQDYDLANCKVEYWMSLPEAPNKKGGK